MRSPEMGMGSPEQETPEYNEGDKVKLTEEKIAELEKGGFMAGFPQTEGVVSVVSGDMMSVQFGHSVRKVEKKDVVKVE